MRGRGQIVGRDREIRGQWDRGRDVERETGDTQRGRDMRGGNRDGPRDGGNQGMGRKMRQKTDRRWCGEAGKETQTETWEEEKERQTDIE